MSKRSSIIERLKAVMASNAFFYFTLILLFVQSLWIALSSSYPLPFDEYFHLGLIEIYSHQFSPLISHQSANAALYGDITRNPSFLYHYIMSYPFRLIHLLFHSPTPQIISLRIINIILFCIGIVLFKKVLQKLELSKTLIHLSLFLFVLIPLVPLLAAHINYDNLLFVLVPLVILIAIKIVDSKTVRSDLLICLITICLFASMVKYAFLPIFLAILIYITYYLLKAYGHKLSAKMFESFTKLSVYKQVILLGVLMVAIVLFSFSYGINAVKYHSIQPSCEKVQPISVCEQNPPWIRNQQYTRSFKQSPTHLLSVVGFNKVWVPKMINDAFIAFTYTRVDPINIYGPLGPIVTKEAPSIPKAAFKILALVGVIFVLINLKRLLKDRRWKLILITVSLYVIALWLTNYSGYKQVGQIVAIQPRYILIILPLILGLMAQVFNWTIKNEKVKASILLVVFLAMTQGGGVGVYILRSDPSWYWPNRAVVNINQQARNILEKTILLK